MPSNLEGAPKNRDCSKNNSIPGDNSNKDEVSRDSIANMIVNDRVEEEQAPSVAEIPESECFLTSMLEFDNKYRTTSILIRSL